MKLLKITIAFLLLVSLQIAAAQWLNVPPPVEARNLMVVGGGVPAAAASYLLSENFDGAVGCKAGSAPSNCNNQWTVQPAYAWGTFDTTTNKIEGTYSHQSATTDQYIFSPAFSATTTIYVFFKIRVARVSDGTNNPLYKLLTSDGSPSFIRIKADADGSGWYFAVAGCGAASDDSPKYAYDTVYNVWVDYVTGTGANSSIDVYASTTSTRGSSASNYSTGNCTAGVTNFMIGTGDAVQSTVLTDHIRVSSSSMSAGVPD